MTQATFYNFWGGTHKHDHHKTEDDREHDLDRQTDDENYRGARCAKCGKPLHGGGLVALGWGKICWACWHSPLGRKDGRTDLSSDADGARNSGYNLRR